jgi:DNA-binding transcriptional regulator YhcF (GntR family)
VGEKGEIKVFEYNEVSKEPGESSLKAVYKNKPNKYLYCCIVYGIVGKDNVSAIKPNEELPSFEELTVEYPPWLIRRIFKKLKRKGYVVERNGKLIAVDTGTIQKIKNTDEGWFNIILVLFGVSFLGFLCTLTFLLV